MIFNDEGTRVNPWEVVVHADMTGPWKVKFKMNNKIYTPDIQALRLVDKATSQLKIVTTLIESSELVADLVGNERLHSYPRPR